LTGIFGKAAGALALGAVAFGAMSQTAHAQATETAAQKPFAVKISSYTPVNKGVREASANFIFGLEADWTIQDFSERNSLSILTAGYMERDGFRIMPLTVSQIWRDPNNPSGKDYYYGVGVGLYSTRLQAANTSNRVKNLLGGFVVVGMNLTPRYFVEGKYHLISRYDTHNINSAQLSLGVRF
jgi:hypothetical protein